MSASRNKHYDYIIVGTGPGGAPVARDLAKEGRSVLILERGVRNEKTVGVPFGPLLLDGYGLFCRSMEGCYIARGITLGGSTLLYNGNAFDPPRFLFEKMGIDFSQEVDELRNELPINVLPERFFENSASLFKMMDAASARGYKVKPQEKYIDPDKCRVGCDTCMLGCKRGAKWTTREMVDEAMRYGADLMVGTRVRSIIIEKGKSKGVSTWKGKKIYGDNVIVAGGGVSSPRILLRSGINKHVGENFFVDPIDAVIGYAKEPGQGAWGQMSFTHAFNMKEDGHVLVGNVAVGATLLFGLMRANILMNNLSHLPYLKQGIGLFAKLADQPNGRVYADGRISKPILPEDQRRMKKATDLCREILIEIGVDPKSIVVGKSLGGHLGGTVAMGRAVDTNFMTEIQNLYVCDGSVLPISPGAPPSLALLAMSHFFAKTLLGTVRPEDRQVKTTSDA
jgi:choline dehydrogenase-like flavoprotein